MVIFENDHGDHSYISSAVQATEMNTAHALAKFSLELQCLIVSFVTDASYFFDACQKWNVWPNLESLTLTSTALSSQEPIHVNDLLKKAALMAMKMPRLKLMELWHYKARHAGVFQYQTSESDWIAKITWQSTWDLVLEPHVLHLWQNIIAKRMNCKLQFIVEMLDVNIVINTHGDALPHLMLLNEVIHPVSLWQMQKEASYQNKSRYS